MNKQDRTWLLWLLVECLPNRLTPLYSKIYYKEKNYLKVKTVVFKYINSSIVKFGTSVRRYVGIFGTWVCKYISTFSTCIITWLSYPLSYGFTGFISFVSRVLILTQYKSPFSTCTILFIRSVTGCSWKVLIKYL